MLKNYKEDEAMLTELQLKIEEYGERLEYAGTVHEDTAEEVIADMQLAGQAYDSIHSNTNKISDKTANTALNYKKEQRHINKEDRAYLTRKINEFETEKEKLNKKVVRVKNMLNRITKEEKFVISEFYFERSKWDYIEKIYFEEFEKHKSIKQLQAYRDNALNQMLNIINVGM
jgi:hypothetical protein